MPKTADNLEQALALEAGASIRYLVFAEKADQEGHPGVASLFRAAAKAEMYHALSLLRAMGPVEGTEDNLKTAAEGETHELKEIYPAMIREAAAENALEARYSLEYAMSIEMILAKLFRKALGDPHAFQQAVYFVCPVCGNTVAGKPPGKCPYCGVDEKQFVEVT